MSDVASEVTKHEFPCQGCGAKLTYAPGQDALLCPYCGHRQDIGDDADEQAPIVEYDLQQALTHMRRQPAGARSNSGQEIRCTSCAAISTVAGQADHCPFCGSPVVLHHDEAELFVPESLLPFAIDERQAREAFSQWAKTRWFAPNDLTKLARVQGADGVYLPYWTYDSATSTRYTGRRGDHYYVTESYTDAQGNRQTRQVQRTRWRSVSGTVHVAFDDVLICASRSLPTPLVERLEPWDLQTLRPYDPAYLSGFMAERYSIDLPEGFELAQAKMDPVIRQHIRRDIGGDVQTILSTHIQHRDTRFKHLLLPLWISCFRYRDRVFRFVVNARTGEVSGERPWSVAKIVATVLAALLLITIAVLLYRQAQG